MEPNRFALRRRALQVLDALAPEEQKQVLDKLEALGKLPREQWPMHEFSRLPGEEPLYLLRIPPRLRLFVRMDDGSQPEVLDIVHRDRLAAFASSKT